MAENQKRSIKLRWDRQEVVATLSTTSPNARLIQFAAQELGRNTGARLLDIGCGAGCNAVPLVAEGWNVLGMDLSEPMLEASRRRAQEQALTDRLTVQSAPMDRLPVKNQRVDFIVAHGIWPILPRIGIFCARASNHWKKNCRKVPMFGKRGAVP